MNASNFVNRKTLIFTGLLVIIFLMINGQSSAGNLQASFAAFSTSTASEADLIPTQTSLASPTEKLPTPTSDPTPTPGPTATLAPGSWKTAPILPTTLSDRALAIYQLGQLMGNNHGPNPQELLLSGLGSCMMVSFIAGATAEGIQLETVRIDFDATLDLRGFMGLATNSTVGFPEIRYQIHVTGDATAEG